MSRLESLFQQHPQKRVMFITALILVAALSRLIPHPWNFSPIESIALFGGAVFANRRAAFLIPLAALFISDVIIGFHNLMWLVYGCMIITTLLGRVMQNKVNASRIAGFGLLSAVIFFVATNLAVWLGSGMYPLNTAGLSQCFIAAIPFFKNQLAGVAVYSSLLFGAWYWIGSSDNTSELNLGRS